MWSQIMISLAGLQSIEKEDINSIDKAYIIYIIGLSARNSVLHAMLTNSD